MVHLVNCTCSLTQSRVELLRPRSIGPVIGALITVDVEVTTEWAVTAGMIASAWSAMQSHLLLLAHFQVRLLRH